MESVKYAQLKVNEKFFEISKKYEEISSKEVANLDVEEVLALREECKNVNFMQYLYLCDILMADILINMNKLDEALSIMLQDNEELADDQYPEIHISILDRIIYVYITNQYYQSALRYVNDKKRFFNNPTPDMINRWYLEMAYIHEALGEKNRSLIELTSILENNPDDSLRLVVLMNITKLFIDSGNINEALTNLGDCFALCFKLDDKESENYCNYLRAKIYRLQKSYKKAVKFFEDLFKTLENIDDDNFNYLNEYIGLLLDIKDFSIAKKVSEKFLEKVDNSNDLYNKKIFYENYLRVRTNIATGNKNNVDYLFDIINNLEKRINKNKDVRINEINDAELSFEIKNNAKVITDKIADLILSLKEVNFDTLRNYLMKFSSVLEKKCGINEVGYFIFTRDCDSVVPTKLHEISNIEAYNYKVNRFYERVISYQDLEKTVIEMVFNGNNNVALEINKSNDIIDPISHLQYADLQIKYVNAYALTNNDKLYGAIVYTSKSNDITDETAALLLCVATSIIEQQLLKIFSYINLEEQKGLIDTALSGVDINIIYQNINTNKLFLPDKIKQLIGLNTQEIFASEYEKLIDSSDILKYREKKIAIENKKEYKVSYHLNIEGKVFSIYEQAKPYNDNYYYGTISNTDVTKSITTLANVDKVYLLEDLLNEITQLKEFAINNKTSFDVSCFKLNIKDKVTTNEKNFIIKDIYQIIKTIYGVKVYLLDNLFVVISLDKTLNKHLKEAKKLLDKKYELGSKVVKTELKCFTLSYPKQILKIDDLMEMIYFCCEKLEEETLDKNNYAKFIAYKTVNDCAYSALMAKEIDFVFSALYKGEELIGYLGIPNIKGINSQDALLSISSDLKIKLDEKQVLSLMNIKENNLYLNVSMQSLKNMIITNEKSLTKKKLNIILEDLTKDYIDVIKELKLLGHSIIINGNDLNKLTMELIDEGAISGVYNINKDNKEYLKYLGEEVFCLTTDKEFKVENKTIIYISKEIVKL